jgi:hypothetical protein
MSRAPARQGSARPPAWQAKRLLEWTKGVLVQVGHLNTQMRVCDRCLGLVDELQQLPPDAIPLRPRGCWRCGGRRSC